MAKRAPQAAAAHGGIPTSAPVAVLHGPERFLHLEHTRALLEALKKAHGEVDLLTFDGEKAAPADVLDECRSLGLMVTRKLVIVDNADEMLKAGDDEDDTGPAPFKRGGGGKSARELMEAYCAAPEPATTLLLRAALWRKSKIDALVAGAGGVLLACETPSDADALRWAVSRAQHHHRATLQPDAGDALIKALGADLARLDSELGKLAIVLAARGAGATITADLVREMVGQSREDEIWAFQRGVLSGDPGEALKELHRALDVSRHNPVAVNVAYLSLCQKLDGIARGLAAGESFGAIAARLRLWGADALVATAKRLGPGRTGALLQRAVDTDARLKSGRGDPVHLIEVLTLDLARGLGGSPAARA